MTDTITIPASSVERIALDERGLHLTLALPFEFKDRLPLRLGDALVVTLAPAPRAAVADLVCSKCGASPEPGLPAKAGGTHYQKHAGVRGRNSDFHCRATTCGTWVERQPPKEPCRG